MSLNVTENRLVLGFINADFCKLSSLLKAFSSSTQVSLHCSQLLQYLKIFAPFLPKRIGKACNLEHLLVLLVRKEVRCFTCKMSMEFPEFRISQKYREFDERDTENAGVLSVNFAEILHRCLCQC